MRILVPVRDRGRCSCSILPLPGVAFSFRETQRGEEGRERVTRGPREKSRRLSVSSLGNRPWTQEETNLLGVLLTTSPEGKLPRGIISSYTSYVHKWLVLYSDKCPPQVGTVFPKDFFCFYFMVASFGELTDQTPCTNHVSRQPSTPARECQHSK